MGTIVSYCEICGKQFVPYRSFHKRCCDRCRTIATEKKQYYVKKKEVTKKCLHCGKEFVTNDSKRRYCLTGTCYEDHQVTYHRKKKPVERVCPQCGVTFETTHPTKVYCLTPCYKLAKKERERRNV